eukprot:7388918-Prymnesium_polylepis.2
MESKVGAVEGKVGAVHQAMDQTRDAMRDEMKKLNSTVEALTSKLEHLLGSRSELIGSQQEETSREAHLLVATDVRIATNVHKRARPAASAVEVKSRDPARYVWLHSIYVCGATFPICHSDRNAPTGQRMWHCNSMSLGNGESEAIRSTHAAGSTTSASLVVAEKG